MKRELANPGKSAYLIYTDWMRTLMDMPGEIRAKINDALYSYCLYREEPEDPMVKYSLFALMKKVLDEDEAKFEDKMQRKKSARSEAGKKGMQKRYSKDLKENEVSNKTNTDTVTVTVTDTEYNESSSFMKEEEDFFQYLGFFDPREFDHGDYLEFWIWMKKQIIQFGKTQNISEEKIKKFIEISELNTSLYLLDGNVLCMYDNVGNPIKNWKGALINFSQVDYEKWKAEHGIKTDRSKRKRKG